MEIKNENEIKKIREAGRIVAKIHELIIQNSRPNISLNELDKIAHDYIKKMNVKPSFLNYQGYPKTICTSLNNAMIHGVPNDKKLKEGDVLSIDVAVEYEGFVADGATTFGIGNISTENKKIIEVTKKILMGAIDIAKEGNTLGDISNFIYSEAKKNGYSVSKNFAGHFIGKNMHEEPLVLNYGKKGKGLILKEGMTLCIEPIIFKGEENVIIDPIDNWTIYLKNGSISTHEEHTIVVRKNKGEILTKL